MAAALRELSGVTGELPWGVDGCAAPNFALPLAGLRARWPSCRTGIPRADTRRRHQAHRARDDRPPRTGRRNRARLHGVDARRRRPRRGEDRRRGLFRRDRPGSGLGIALKIDDGAGRAAETAIAAILDKLGVLGYEAQDFLPRR